jgi:hypothetical protein
MDALNRDIGGRGMHSDPVVRMISHLHYATPPPWPPPVELDTAGLDLAGQTAIGHRYLCK